MGYPLINPGLQFFDNSGAVLDGGLLYSYAPGTTTPKTTYNDADLDPSHANTNPIELDSAGRCAVFLTNGEEYKFVLKDADGVTLWTRDYVKSPSDLTQAAVGQFLWPRTSEEIAAGVTPTSYAYEPGNVLRYGADASGVADSSTPFQDATDTTHPVIIPKGTYKVAGLSYTGRVIWRGEGEASVIRADARVIAVTNGTGSQFENFWMENITAPWIITRDPENWTADPTSTLQQSNDDGYQPTVNDTDIWGSLSAAQQNQHVGPEIYFEGLADNIHVSRIYGRFAAVYIKGAFNSCVSDCNLRGKKQWGAITFDNTDAGFGTGNRVINNYVTYASNSGIAFLHNVDFEVRGNIIGWSGEAGIKTVGGASYYSFRGNISDNTVFSCYYGGIDAASMFPLDTSQGLYHVIEGNIITNCREAGIGFDGNYVSCRGNVVSLCQWEGIYAAGANALIAGNLLVNNGRLASHGDMLVGGSLNLVDSNRIIQVDSVGSGIWSVSANVVRNNYVTGGSFGFGGTIVSTENALNDNIDENNGLVADQNFLVRIVNTAGTLQHSISGVAEKVKGRSSSLSNTPTGADGSTAFTAGGKIGSANANYFWLDTLAQSQAHVGSASMVYCSVGLAITARATTASVNINGVTHVRLLIDFYNAVSGAVFDLTTANIASGKEIQVAFVGKLN